MDLPVTPGPFLGRSKAVAQLLELVERAARVDVPVLLTGETGTGKSHLARLLHARSPRSRGPFVSVNCAGFPDGLFESEFFGHCRGAFTGAVESREGLFEQATDGVLFLDEVGELPLSQQAKLLTVLEEKRVRPVGGARPRPVDTRVVSATSRDIQAELAAGAFRADLYHRIALIRCELPPLRTRPEDLRLLTSWMLTELSRKYRRPGLTLTREALARIAEHPWPGNVRELAHVLEAGAILSRTPEIDAEQLEPMLAGSVALTRRAGTRADAPGAPGQVPAHGSAPTAGDHSSTVAASDVGGAAGSVERSTVGGNTGRAAGDLVGGAVSRAAGSLAGGAGKSGADQSGSGRPRYSFFGSELEEREAIRTALVRTRGNRTRAARELGMARNTLGEKMRKYRLDG